MRTYRSYLNIHADPKPTATPSEIENAISEDRALVIVPIAFVSDHSETLVELDLSLIHI